MNPSNEYAFPVNDSNIMGMTLRDYFAAKAMVSLILDGGYANKDWPNNISNDAHKVADAMLKERAK